MPAIQLRGKSLAAVAAEIADGFFMLNPLVLKKFEEDTCRGLHEQLRKLQTSVRGERFPQNDFTAVRQRNSRLQRLHSSLVILEKHCKDRRIRL